MSQPQPWQTHVIGRPSAFECECGACYMLQRWERDETSRVYHITHLQHVREYHCCPFCGGRTGMMEVVHDG